MASSQVHRFGAFDAHNNLGEARFEDKRAESVIRPQLAIQ